MEKMIIENLGIEKENINNFLEENKQDIKDIEKYLKDNYILLNNKIIVISDEDYIYNKDLSFITLFKGKKLSIVNLI